MSQPASSNDAQHPSYRTNVNRSKTKRWVEAKSYTYDGDDWGEVDDYDEYGGYEEPPQAPKPTGLRQRGSSITQSASSTLNNARQDDFISPGPINPNVASEQPQYGDRQRPDASMQHSFINDEANARERDHHQPIAFTAPPQIDQLAGHHQRSSSITAGTQPIPSTLSEAKQGTFRPPDRTIPDQHAPTSQAFDQPPRQSSFDQPIPSMPHIAKKSTDRTADTRIGHNQAYSSQTGQELASRRMSPQHDSRGGAPPRKSSLAQQYQPSLPFDPAKPPLEPLIQKPPTVVGRDRSASGSPAAKALPFVRPADIYRRMEEEREKERRSQETARPNLVTIGAPLRKDQIMDAPKGSASEAQPDKGIPGSASNMGGLGRGRESSSAEKAQSNAHKAEVSMQNPIHNKIAGDHSHDASAHKADLLLPDPTRMSGFGTGFGESFMGTDSNFQPAIVTSPIIEEGNVNALPRGNTQPQIRESQSDQSTDTQEATRGDHSRQPLGSPKPSTGPDRLNQTIPDDPKLQRGNSRRAIEKPTVTQSNTRNSSASTHTPRPTDVPGGWNIEPIVESATTADSRIAGPSSQPRLETRSAKYDIAPTELGGTAVEHRHISKSAQQVSKQELPTIHSQAPQRRPNDERDQSFRPHLPGSWESTVSIAPIAPDHIPASPAQSATAPARGNATLRREDRTITEENSLTSANIENDATPRGSVTISPHSVKDLPKMPIEASLPPPRIDADSSRLVLSKTPQFENTISTTVKQTKNPVRNEDAVADHAATTKHGRRLSDLPSLSTNVKGSQYESDRLRREITRDLTPGLQSEPSTAETDSSLQQSSADLFQGPVSDPHHTSEILPSEYDSYWNDSGEGTTSKNHGSIVKHSDSSSAELEAGQGNDVLKDSLPEVAAPESSVHIKDNAQHLQHRFSWEQPLADMAPTEPTLEGASDMKSETNVQSSQVPMKPTQVQSSERPSSEVAGSDPIPVAQETERLDTGQRNSLNIRETGERSAGILSHDETPISTNEGLPQYEGAPPYAMAEKSPLSIGTPGRAADQQIKSEKSQQFHPDGAVSNAQKTAQHLSSTQHEAPLPPSPQVKPPAFREIMAQTSCSARIMSFKESQKQYNNMETGLTKWMKTMMSQFPEHGDVIIGYASNGTGPEPSQVRLNGAGPATTSGQSPNSPYYQQYLDASPQSAGPGTVMFNTGSSPLTAQATSGGRVSSQQVQAKSKELLHTAGVFGGKANVAAKGLFSKGKNKLRDASGSRKAFTNTKPYDAARASGMRHAPNSKVDGIGPNPEARVDQRDRSRSIDYVTAERNLASAQSTEQSQLADDEFSEESLPDTHKQKEEVTGASTADATCRETGPNLQHQQTFKRNFRDAPDISLGENLQDITSALASNTTPTQADFSSLAGGHDHLSGTADRGIQDFQAKVDKNEDPKPSTAPKPVIGFPRSRYYHESQHRPARLTVEKEEVGIGPDHRHDADSWPTSQSWDKTSRSQQSMASVSKNSDHADAYDPPSPLTPQHPAQSAGENPRDVLATKIYNEDIHPSFSADTKEQLALSLEPRVVQKNPPPLHHVGQEQSEAHIDLESQTSEEEGVDAPLDHPRETTSRKHQSLRRSSALYSEDQDKLVESTSSLRTQQSMPDRRSTGSMLATKFRKHSTGPPRPHALQSDAYSKTSPAPSSSNTESQSKRSSIFGLKQSQRDQQNEVTQDTRNAEILDTQATIEAQPSLILQSRSRVMPARSKSRGRIDASAADQDLSKTNMKSGNTGRKKRFSAVGSLFGRSSQKQQKQNTTYDTTKTNENLFTSYPAQEEPHTITRNQSYMTEPEHVTYMGFYAPKVKDSPRQGIAPPNPTPRTHGQNTPHCSIMKEDAPAYIQDAALRQLRPPSIEVPPKDRTPSSSDFVNEALGTISGGMADSVPRKTSRGSSWARFPSQLRVDDGRAANTVDTQDVPTAHAANSSLVAPDTHSRSQKRVSKFRRPISPPPPTPPPKDDWHRSDSGYKLTSSAGAMATPKTQGDHASGIPLIPAIIPIRGNRMSLPQLQTKVPSPSLGLIRSGMSSSDADRFSGMSVEQRRRSRQQEIETGHLTTPIRTSVVPSTAQETGQMTSPASENPSLQHKITSASGLMTMNEKRRSRQQEIETGHMSADAKRTSSVKTVAAQNPPSRVVTEQAKTENEIEDEEPIIMSATSFPGQEWFPEVGYSGDI